ncbi:MAG: 30S ribosome-binding factor RbfA [Clostridia bacterium]
MSNRTEMLGSEMSKLIYENIKKIKDPKCSEMTSVISVDVTKDLKYAKVVLSIFSTDENKRQKTFESIKNASAFIKHCLSQQMSIRTVPTLTFILDNSAEYSAKINTILATLNIKAEEVEETEKVVENKDTEGKDED